MADQESSIVYTLPGMANVQVQRNVAYKTTPQGDALTADIYRTSDVAPDELLPAVIFISGDASPEVMRDLKDSGQYHGWGQLAASSGMAGVTFNHRSSEGLQHLAAVESDVLDLFAFVRGEGAKLGIDTTRLGVWTCSGGPPFALRAVLRDTPPDIRCIAVYYGMLDLTQLLGETDPPEVTARLRAYSAVSYLGENPASIPPMLIARAGLDHPMLNQGLDRFVAEALAQNLTVDVYNHPQGHHAFDTLDDNARSREIISHTLEFLREHLLE